MIIFEKLRWKNLLSSGNNFTEIDLNTHSHTLIVGDNGAGKSTLLDALMFALYGKPFRKINKSQLVNSINNKETVVECEFTVNNKKILVKRGIKPNFFEIYVDTLLINLDSSTTDYQEYFEKNILRINAKSFSQIVILGSASFVPFMQLSAANRREVVEDLLDLQIFSTMNSILKEKVASNQNSVQEITFSIQNIEDKIESEKRFIKEIEKNDSDYIKEKNDDVANYKKVLVDIENHLQNISDTVQGFIQSISDEKTVVSRSSKLSLMVQQLYDKRDKFQDDINFFEHQAVCPTCSQNIEENHKNSIVADIKQKHNKVINGIYDADTKLQEYNQRINEISKIKVEIEHKKSEYNSKKSEKKIVTDLIKKLENDILLKQQSKSSDVSNLESLTVELKQKESLKKQLIEEKALLNVASVMMKDSGIKTKIISQYVPIINQLINKYLADMDFFVNFELDEGFNETIKSRFRDEFSYASFSEGEKSRLDLALLFTWRSIAKLRNSASTNLLILDEVFDGSLDSEGSERLLSIVKNLTKGNNVFIISHKTDAYTERFDRILKFKKIKNFSQLDIS